MSRYPEDPRPTGSYPFRSNRPVVSAGPAWASQDSPLTAFGFAEFDLMYKGKGVWADIMILHDFYESVGGASGRFTYVDFNGIKLPGSGGLDPGKAWTSLFVAKGDGLTLAWDLPTYALAASPAPVLYENGSSAGITSAFYTTTPDRTKTFNIKAGGGTDGVDLLTAGAFLTTVATAPSPATTGTSLVVHTGDGAVLPASNFDIIVWPTGLAPTAANAEHVHVTTRTGDTFNPIVRGVPARTIIVGDQVAIPPAKTVIISIGGTCRRAARRAKFTNLKNPFQLDIPAVYSCGPITIVEVMR